MVDLVGLAAGVEEVPGAELVAEAVTQREGTAQRLGVDFPACFDLEADDPWSSIARGCYAELTDGSSNVAASRSHTDAAQYQSKHVPYPTRLATEPGITRRTWRTAVQ